MNYSGFIDKYFIKKPALRKFITRIFYGNYDKTINLFSTKLFINSLKENGYLRASSYAVKSSVFRDEVSILITLSSFITAGSTFIDVGANVGLYSSTFQKFQNLYSDFKIYAFEANPDTYKRLCKTVQNTRVEVYNYAVSNINGELEFVEGAVSHVFAEKSHSNAYHFRHKKIVKVQAKKLDELNIKGNNIILKVDVEGHEYNVLEGAKKLFENGCIKVVYLDGFKETEKVIPYLRHYSFDFYDGKTFEKNEGSVFSLLAVKTPEQVEKLLS